MPNKTIDELDPSSPIINDKVLFSEGGVSYQATLNQLASTMAPTILDDIPDRVKELETRKSTTVKAYWIYPKLSWGRDQEGNRPKHKYDSVYAAAPYPGGWNDPPYGVGGSTDTSYWVGGGTYTGNFTDEYIGWDKYFIKSYAGYKWQGYKIDDFEISTRSVTTRKEGLQEDYLMLKCLKGKAVLVLPWVGVYPKAVYNPKASDKTTTHGVGHPYQTPTTFRPIKAGETLVTGKIPFEGRSSLNKNWHDREGGVLVLMY